jgi:hypothetical protein
MRESEESVDQGTSDFEAMSRFWEAALERLAAYAKSVKDFDNAAHAIRRTPDRGRGMR